MREDRGSRLRPATLATDSVASPVAVVLAALVLAALVLVAGGAVAQEPATGGQAAPTAPPSEQAANKAEEEKGKAEAAAKKRFAEQVVVTATRSERDVENLPVSATVVSREEVERSPDTQVDDVLRSVAGINLPSGTSETQYPSRNTVSMRGLGGSRALVLLDGVPINDPMFGHINWNKVQPESVERIEVVRGGSANLFGSYAMGGTINILSRPVVDGAISADVSYGSLDTARGAVSFAREVASGVRIGVDLGAGRSDGYNRIPEENRRPVDTVSGWESSNARVKAEFDLSSRARGYVTGGYYSYDLSAGTAVSETRRDSVDLSAGAVIGTLADGEIAVSVFYEDLNFDVDNPAIIAGGTQVFRSNRNETPGQQIGGSVQWSKGLGTSMPLLVVGVDARQMEADSFRENFNSAGDVTSTQRSGGQQDSAGVFAQVSWTPTSRFEVLAGARVDYWRNHGGYDVLSSGSDQSFEAKKVTEFNPRLAMRYDLGGGLGLRAAAYRGFGAPNLSALYRSSSFRGQENVPNPDLGPETMVGGEVGLDLAVPRFRGQVNLFQNRVEDVITSVLVHTEPLVGFQLQNIGTARSRGLELLGEAYLGDRWSVSGSYAYSDSTTIDSPANPVLEGKRVPYAPRNSGSLGVTYRVPRGMILSARVLYVGDDFADAENLLLYDSHTLVDLFASMPLSERLDAYAAVTNTFDEAYLDDIAPTTRRGAPRQARIGLRFRTALAGSAAARARRP